MEAWSAAIGGYGHLAAWQGARQGESGRPNGPTQRALADRERGRSGPDSGQAGFRRSGQRNTEQSIRGPAIITVASPDEG